MNNLPTNDADNPAYDISFLCYEGSTFIKRFKLTETQNNWGAREFFFLIESSTKKTGFFVGNLCQMMMKLLVN